MTSSLPASNFQVTQSLEWLRELPLTDPADFEGLSYVKQDHNSYLLLYFLNQEFRLKVANVTQKLDLKAPL